MHATPFVSVIVAVKTGSATLERVLRSLVAQDFERWEAVLVDDGSSDATPLVIERMKAGEPRMRALERPGLGVSAARNAGIAAARADWLMFLDADDPLDPGHLSALVRAVERWPKADLLVLDWCVTDHQGRTGPLQRASFDPSPAEALAARCPFPLHSTLARAAAVRKVEGFDGAMQPCEDWDLWQRMVQAGAVVRRADGAVARDVLSPGSASTQAGAFLESGIAVIRRGHGTDPAMAAPAAEALLAVWLAGQVLGSQVPGGGSAAALLSGGRFRVPDHPDPRLLAGTLLSGIERGTGSVEPDWPAVWTGLRPAALAAMRCIEQAGKRPGIARATMVEAERQLARRASAGPDTRIGDTLVRTFDVEEAHPTSRTDADRITGIVAKGGREVGRFEAFGAEVADAAVLEGILADFVGAEPFDGAWPEPASAPGEPDYWETLFAREDPWDYGNAYETTKYDQTIQAIPGRARRALELACAEGTFTRRLLARADHVLATDISPTAVARARARLGDAGRVDFEVLDFQQDPLPENHDLIVCSEVLYYLDGQARLDAVARKFAAALAPGGHLLMTHANLVADDPDRTGFDWPHPFGARRIADTFASLPDLVHVSSSRSELYRIEVFRKDDGPAGEPAVRPLACAQEIPAGIARHIVRAGTNPEPEGVPVLMYHRITDRPEPALARWSVAPAMFREQMEWLCSRGFTAVTMADFEALVWEGAALPPHPVLVTFDDGYRDFATNAAPVLAELEMPATVFLPTDHVGGSSDWDAPFGPPADLMDWDEIGRLAAQGIGFAAHSRSHRLLTSLPYESLLPEILDPPRLIADRLGAPVTTMAYPFGACDEAIQRSLFQHGCRLAFTTEHRRWRERDKVMAIPRLDVPGDLDLAGFARLMGRG